MRCVKFEPGKPGQVVQVVCTYDALQIEIGGIPDVLPLTESYVAICDNERYLKHLPANAYGLTGTVLICGRDTDLSSAEAKLIILMTERFQGRSENDETR